MSSSGATRRTNNTSSQPNGTSSTMPPSSTPKQQRASFLYHPLLPTQLEGLLLAIYPATLILGSLFSLLNPLSRYTPYNANIQSHPPELAPSYFAQKKNLFNVFFVKIGWFWTTLAFITFLFLHPSTGPSRTLSLTKRRTQALARYGLVTAWWIALTQWFFGPAIIDRGFRLTGGVCQMAEDLEMGNTAGGDDGKMRVAKEFITSATCRVSGGQWRGGHDISGHVFLLVLGSAFLWLEILPVVMKYAGLREERRLRMEDGRVVRAAEVIRSKSDGEPASVEARSGVSAPIAVAALSWWMLLMTAAYFHTWFEKFTGLLVAFIAIATVYLIPRAIPIYRAVVGIPAA
ncbi:hypothetical protein MMC25_000903 [Agyrium rufum]|nr:hypothetical protein [Agyrium rufum]